MLIITSLIHSYRSGNVPCIEVWTKMQNSGLGNVIKCHLFFQITLITCNINTELEIKNSNARYSLTLEFKSFSNHFFWIQLYYPDRKNSWKPESFPKMPSKLPRTSHLHVHFCLRKSKKLIFNTKILELQAIRVSFLVIFKADFTQFLTLKL